MDHTTPFLVTTSRTGRGVLSSAKQRAERIGALFVSRMEIPLTDFFEQYNALGIWVENSEAPMVQTRKGELGYHEGTAALRTKRKRAGVDALVRALDLQPRDQVLDATLGMGFDALVIAAGLGPAGSVTGLEASPLLCELVRCGLADYQYTSPRLAQAAQRISAVCARHEAFLEQCAPNSYDSVYFDPMFESTIEKSSSMQRMREIAVHDPLSDRSLDLAVRAARRRVVIKCRRTQPGKFSFHEFIPSGRSVGYGVILCDSGPNQT